MRASGCAARSEVPSHRDVEITATHDAGYFNDRIAFVPKIALTRDALLGPGAIRDAARASSAASATGAAAA